MAGPKPKYAVILHEQQHKDLKQISQSHSLPWVEVQRARILVLAHEHPDWNNSQIAKAVGSCTEMVKKCRRRWQTNPSVKSSPRPGTRRKFTALQRSQIIALACSKPRDHGKPFKRWSAAKLAETAIEKGMVSSISPGTVREWLRKDKIKPWQYHSWQKPTDPEFVEKASPILDLYEKAPELAQKGEAVVCTDEKTSIQARRLLNETLPAIPEKPVRVSDRYERKGAVQLFCALMAATGKTFAKCIDTKCFSDFQIFLLQLFAGVLCQGLKVLHLILDNGTTHAPKRLGAWIASLQLSFEVRIYWLPKHASWLDQVEIIFSKLQRHVLTPCDFNDKEQLEAEIMSYFNYLNQNPKPIRWTYTKEKMTAQFCALPN
jgi:transposase